MDGPLEILYSPQALVCAVIATIITQAFKALMDVAWGRAIERATADMGPAAPLPPPKQGPYRSLTEIKAIGKQQRAPHWVLNQLLLPVVPVAVGIVYAWVVPYRPESLEAYMVNHHLVGTAWWLVVGAWGAVCGQFSVFVFDRAKNLINGFVSQNRERSRDDGSNNDRGAP